MFLKVTGQEAALDEAAQQLEDMREAGWDVSWERVEDAPAYCAACLYAFTESDAKPEAVLVNGRWRLMHGSCRWRVEHGVEIALGQTGAVV